MLMAVAAVLGTSGLGQLPGLAAAPSAAAAAREDGRQLSGLLTIAAAASLADAFAQIGQAFERSHPGVTVRFNFAASGILLQQLVRGAPIDVLATADAQTMQRASERGVVDPRTRVEFAANTLVLVEPRRRPAGMPALAALDDLRADHVKRIALGKPETVPVGNYARQVLVAGGLWELLQPKLIPADSTRQVLDYVGRGEVAAGFVYSTDAALSEQVRVVLVLAPPLHEAIRYPAAVVHESSRRELAGAFVRYLQLPDAQSILRRHGFAAP